VDYIKTSRDPFTKEVQDLFNIATGKAVSQEISSFLLNIREIGQQDSELSNAKKTHKNFMNQSLKSRFRYLRNKRVENKTKEDKWENLNINIERDLMDRIVTIILEKKIYLEQILSYPLTPVPMCLAHMNGKTNKTTKLTLFKELENWPPRKMDANVVTFFSCGVLCKTKRIW
jgi:hypothetical protein